MWVDESALCTKQILTAKNNYCTRSENNFWIRLYVKPAHIRSFSVTWSCRSTMMGLWWGREAAGWSMRGGVLVWLYCLDSSKGTCGWCWEKIRWWKFSSWTRELNSTGLSRLPQWCLSGGLERHTGKEKGKTVSTAAQLASTGFQWLSRQTSQNPTHIYFGTLHLLQKKKERKKNINENSTFRRWDWIFTFSWDALERCRALQGIALDLRGLLVAAYLLLFPMVALVTSCKRVTLWERKTVRRRHSYVAPDCRNPAEKIQK